MKNIFCFLFMFHLCFFSLLAQEEVSRLAIANFEVYGDLKPEVGVSAADFFASKLNTNRFQIVERIQIKKIIGERLIQSKDILGEEEIRKLTDDLQAEYILLGGIEKDNDGKWAGHCRITEIKTASVKNDYKVTAESNKDCQELIMKLAGSLESKLARLTNLVVTSDKLAKDIAKDLKKFAPKDIWKVMVLPFGNAENQATATLGDIPLLMQSELIRALRQELSGEEMPFEIWNASQIKKHFAKHKTTPYGISCDDLQASLEILKDLEIDVAIVSKFDIQTSKIFDDDEWILWESNVILAKENTIKTYYGTIFGKELETLGNITKQRAKRFGIEFWLESEDTKNSQVEKHSDGKFWKKLSLQRCTDTNSPWYNVFILPLEQSYKNKRYKIRLYNYGKPSCDEFHPLDHDRIFAAAVLIDGVSSFYETQPDGTMAKTILHPNKATKWVLTSPGRALISDKNGMDRVCPDPNNPGKLIMSVEDPKKPLKTTIENGKLIDVKGLGHSCIDVIGFQNNNNEAGVFQFAEAKDSVAETLGISHQIGLISVYFYPEILPNISLAPDAGTSEGPKVPNEVFPINFQRKQEPTATLHIVYRYTNNLPVSKESLNEVK